MFAQAAENDWDRDPTCKVCGADALADHMRQAMFAFRGALPCDLSFAEGDVITILTRTPTQDDWWEGRLHGKVGIFPANFVKLL